MNRGKLGKKILIFGGYGSGALNDLWELDTETMTWAELMPNGQAGAPSARDGLGNLVQRNGKFYLFGGWIGSTLNDLWQLSYGN